MKIHKKKSNREMRIAKTLSAKNAIGKIRKNSDTYILTFGQFSLIDAVIAIIDQVGPSDVVLSTWTAADAHLEKTQEMLESSDIMSLRMIIDRSFETRQPKYCQRMRNLFGVDCIRHIRNHAKFVIITNQEYKITIRTSMNLNENPRLENIEVSEDEELTDFMLKVVDEIFSEVAPLEKKSKFLEMEGVQEVIPYKEIHAPKLRRSNYGEIATTHQITK
jgi:hypothetical protein